MAECQFLRDSKAGGLICAETIIVRSVGRILKVRDDQKRVECGERDSSNVILTHSAGAAVSWKKRMSG